LEAAALEAAAPAAPAAPATPEEEKEHEKEKELEQENTVQIRLEEQPFGPDALKHIGPFCPTIARTSTTSSLPTSRCAECFETAIRFGPSRKFLYKFLMHIFPGVTLEPGEYRLGSNALGHRETTPRGA
jgi:hypothetical protein